MPLCMLQLLLFAQEGAKNDFKDICQVIAPDSTPWIPRHRRNCPTNKSSGQLSPDGANRRSTDEDSNHSIGATSVCSSIVSNSSCEEQSSGSICCEPSPLDDTLTCVGGTEASVPSCRHSACTQNETSRDGAPEKPNVCILGENAETGVPTWR